MHGNTGLELSLGENDIVCAWDVNREIEIEDADVVEASVTLPQPRLLNSSLVVVET